MELTKIIFQVLYNIGIYPEFNILRFLYFLVLLYSFIQTISWTWRRIQVLLDMKQLSMSAIFKLFYCLIFLVFTMTSIGNLIAPRDVYRAYPFMILIMSINLLYLITSLASNYYKELKKLRLLICSFMLAIWSLVGTFTFTINISQVRQIPYTIAFSNSGASLGWELFGKILPFWTDGIALTYTNISLLILNIFNFICLSIIIVFSRLIPKLKIKLYSFKYLFYIDILILLRDLSFKVFTKADYSYQECLSATIMGIALCMFSFAISIFYACFIRSEGKYDRNLKKLRRQTLKKDINNIIKDFNNSDTLRERVECVSRLRYLIARNHILETKVNVEQEVKVKCPSLYAHFKTLSNDEITLSNVSKFE